MGRSASYHSRNFSRATKATAYYQSKDDAGIARCANCTAPLFVGHIHYDHITPWEMCRYSGPSNCQVLCTPCHLLKTGEQDMPLIADNNRKRASAIGARSKPKHPFPCGRSSRWSKPVGAFRPVRRRSLAQKHADTMARRSIFTQQPEP